MSRVMHGLEMAETSNTIERAVSHIDSAKAQNDHAKRILDFVMSKNRSQRDHINWLQTDNANLRNDLNSYKVATVMLVVTLAIVLYQWLVVCDGNAPW